jgi:hypothetical protein
MYGGVGGVQVYYYVFLTSALDGSEWSATRSGRSTPVKMALVPVGQEGMTFMSGVIKARLRFLLLLLLLLLRWMYSPMWTFTSLMDLSQSSL